MGALGNLTRKIRKTRQSYDRVVLQAQREAYSPRAMTGFYNSLTDAQKRLVVKDGDVVTFPMEMSRAELEERSTVGEVQPSHPMRYQSHGHETKGRVFNGECNRAACNNWRATYYNVGTYSYYCRPCGWAINEAPQGRGKPLCIEVTENLTHARMDELYKGQYA
ncbi:hypothetical protein EVC20_154 [Rhizobium phage RHph_Y2_17_1]|nr:hypothetical protein EVC19_154 [Rhizobium phage RHph_Y2_11]QIG75893.1 hypothetical protein EVC20_154 [Rhizobium phage RHph_Y2_17_1]